MKTLRTLRFVLLAAGLPLGAFGVAATAQDTTDRAAGGTQPEAPANPHENAPGWGMLEKYCADCHNTTDWAGGVAFDSMLPEEVPSEAKTWEKAVRKLRGRLMPPAGKPQPDQQTVDTFVSWLETRLDAGASGHHNPGSVVLHRLNRTEYARAVEDLLKLKIDAPALLPKDTESEGFDNVASVLKVSPSFLDQYISAARDVSVMAVGDPTPTQSSKVYRGSVGFGGQNFHQDGLPLGTRGGMLVEHFFPADGEYEFSISTGGGVGYITGLDHRHKVIMTIDDVKVFERELGGAEDLKAADQKQVEAAKEIRDRFQKIRVPVKAGSRKVGVAFVARTFAESDDILQPLNPASGMDRIPRIGGLEVVGPFNVTGLGETPSRRRIFTCRPANESEELPCAQRIIANLARQAFRRPITDADLEAPLRFYKSGRTTEGFEGGIQQALMAILASPKFLYRVEQLPQHLQPGSVYHISDMELASRLSFFLWSQGPDEQLLQLAAQKKLSDTAVLDQQVKRMLADPRSQSLVSNFAYQWLNVDEIDDIDPDPNLFPEFDDALRESFRKEILLFVDSILRSDRSVMDLLTADHTFVNERLALHYEIPNIRGDRFRRITLPDSRRWGLLGKGSVLLGTSYGNRTAPVLRGAWILENITGTPPAAPPPGVETLKENMQGTKALTMRERMKLHRATPSCNSCHGVLDPLGFALENFDAVGKWRTMDREAMETIDARSDLPDGTLLNGPDDLRKRLVARPDQFVQALTEKLMIYGLGRGIEYHDMPAVRAIVRDAAKDHYRFSAIVAGVVKSEPFSMKVMPEGEAASTLTQAALSKPAAER